MNGDRLPIFSKPPFIQVFSNQGGEFSVVNVTKISFGVIMSGEMRFADDPEVTEYKLNFLITEDK